jgi:hypothetical protein
MKMLRTVLCALFLVSAAGWLAGCATDSDDVSSTPWDRPQGWEGPMPSTINQGR